MQDAMWAVMMFAVFALSGTVVYNNLSRLSRVNRTKLWPSVEATIQSGNVETVRHIRFHDIQLPVFVLSYVVDQKPYTERFALSMHTEPVDSLISKMIGRTLTVQYDSQNPARIFIPGNTIEGCKIEQKIGSQIRFYSRN
jgi:hypothetical protein